MVRGIHIKPFLYLVGCLTILQCGSFNHLAADEVIYFFPGGSNPRGLYNFDTVTGISTLRTSVTANNQLFSFDVRPSDGAVFGVDLQSNLFRINPTTGQVTIIGNTGIAEATLTAIAFSPTGTLYLLAQGSGLYTANPVNSNVTSIGTVDHVDRGIVFTSAGTMYGFRANDGALFTIDPATGTSTLVGNSGPPINVLAEDATIGATGLLYMQDFGGNMFQVNPATGERTLLGNAVGSNIVGLFDLSVAVPEPASMMMIGGSFLGVIAAGYWQLRRRRWFADQVLSSDALNDQ